jgi:hypothetical protein
MGTSCLNAPRLALNGPLRVTAVSISYNGRHMVARCGHTTMVHSGFQIRSPFYEFIDFVENYIFIKFPDSTYIQISQKDPIYGLSVVLDVHENRAFGFQGYCNSEDMDLRTNGTTPITRNSALDMSAAINFQNRTFYPPDDICSVMNSTSDCMARCVSK